MLDFVYEDLWFEVTCLSLIKFRKALLRFIERYLIVVFLDCLRPQVLSVLELLLELLFQSHVDLLRDTLLLESVADVLHGLLVERSHHSAANG